LFVTPWGDTVKIRLPALIGCLALIVLAYLSSGLMQALAAIAVLAFFWVVFEAAVAERGR
jgi:hypothetical protein